VRRKQEEREEDHEDHKALITRVARGDIPRLGMFQNLEVPPNVPPTIIFSNLKSKFTFFHLHKGSFLPLALIVLLGV
jgi:hypothetical protein